MSSEIGFVTRESSMSLFDYNLSKTKHLKPDRKIDKLLLVVCAVIRQFKLGCDCLYINVKNRALDHSIDHFGAHSSVG